MAFWKSAFPDFATFKIVINFEINIVFFVGARKKDKILTIYSITLFFLARKLIIEVRHPVKGGLPPGEFFPFSKENGECKASPGTTLFQPSLRRESHPFLS